MSSVEIVGIPQSTYVRVIRIACEEKQIPYTLVPAPPHGDAINVLHPFGKVPGFRHDGFELCESTAIARYLDAAFPGPKLFPDDPKTGALVEQWVSLVNTHMDRTLVRQYLFAYFFPSTPDKSPDRAAIAGVVDKVRAELGLIDRAIATHGYLASPEFSFADANLLPILAYLKLVPESAEAIAAAPHLSAYFDKMSLRPSFQATVPPPVG